MAAVIGALRVNLGLNSAEFEQGMNKAKGALGGLGKAFAAIGGTAILAGFTAGIGQAVGRIEETRKLTAQLDRALANVGNTAQTSGKEVSDFADRLERSTGRAAEEVLAVSTNLATFGFSREVFFDAIELADDMAAAWGGDLKQNVEGLARALADPEKGLAMLTKRGITFTDEQKKMIAGFVKANDLIGAQGVVLDALNEQVKGVAAAGFSGLTKAQANATKAMEDFFETIANAMGVNSGLEMSLTAVAAALDFISANFDVIARGAAVAGAAIVTALGPTIWTVVSGAASAAFAAIVAGLNAVRVAIMTNPIGLIAVALAAAVTAAFMFRDEIKQAIGVDFVGIVKNAVNAVIGAFVGAFDGIKAVWGQLPSAMGDLIYQGAQNSINGVIYLVREAQVTIRGFLGWVDTQLRKIGGSLDLSGFKLMEYADLDNPYAGAADDAFSKFGEAFKGAQKDYLGDLGKALGIVSGQAGSAASEIAGLGTALDGADGEGGGGAAGGAKKLAGASDQAAAAMKAMGDIGKSVASTLASGFKDIFKAVVTGSGNAMDAVAGLVGKLSDLFLSSGFDLLVNAFMGGFGGGLFGGIGKLFGFARGGTIMPGGAGGIDSQLVAFRKSPNERVDITKPGQTLTTGEGGAVNVDVTVGVENGQLVPLITTVSGQVAGRQIKQNNKQLPALMRDANQRYG